MVLALGWSVDTHGNGGRPREKQEHNSVTHKVVWAEGTDA